MTQRGRHAQMVAACALVVLVGGVFPFLVARHFGAFGIPRNDDWAYLRSAFGFADHGTLTGGDWASMNLVGQLVVALPAVWLFGHRVEALQLEVLVLGVAGLLCVLDLARRLLPLGHALLVALTVAIGPLWAALSVSYMTDIPAFAFAMASLAAGALGIGRDLVNGLFCASLVIGVFGFTVRGY